MKNTLIILSLITIFLTPSYGQKKILDHDSYDTWRSIADEQITNDGKWISYILESNGEANPILKVKNSKGEEILSYERGYDQQFTFDSKFLVFKIQPDLEEKKTMRRNKTKKDELPIDSLAIYSLSEGTIEKVPNLKSVKVPEKWSGLLAYTIDDTRKGTDEGEEGEEGETEDEKNEKKDKRKYNKENGYTLVIHDLNSGQKDSSIYVTNYTLAEESNLITFINSGKDSLTKAGVYKFNPETFGTETIYEGKGKYHKLSASRTGKSVGFIVDHDTTKVQIRPNELQLWKASSNSIQKVLDNSSEFLNDGWVLTSNGKLMFSEDESKLFFGISPPPVLEDTTLLDEEIVHVEVWSYADGKLHTQQKVDADDDKKKTYHVVYDINSDKLTQLGSLQIPEIVIADEGNATKALGYDNTPYFKTRSWEGFPDYIDISVVDVNSGTSKKIAEKVRGQARISPKGNYIYWYERIDSAWFAYSIANDKLAQITSNDEVAFYNELNDSPNFPSPYGVMSWTENDEKMLIYDRYDIWEVDPSGNSKPVNLTGNGRNTTTSYRYIKLDDEERFISPGQKLMLLAFNEKDKSETLYEHTYGKSGLKPLISGPYHYADFKKAKDADNLVYSYQSFEVFPDLRYNSLGFKKEVRISNANPQQSEYNWGTAELYSWYSLDGKKLDGMLIKPENFDPNKKYPMIVNFYEKSSNGLHRHRAPSPGRSTINYSFYTSRGYVIFNPDVYYRIGYPGESAYNCVIPGVTSLIEKGFIDEDKIGVQGHSWGGYQIAYLVTQTDIFAAAEAGAPVPNMISAYGGIRWWTGLSRMFQYEHTQSRIGGTLWEYPLRYIENSPIFYIDKINTPLLIMHNDADGHVPWYQGIEFFVSLRRLGKPSWMLNYQEEPHWPLKLQHRRDFNIRMAQFFDHYLKDEPIPVWMKEGRPATEIGINQGYELVPADHQK